MRSVVSLILALSTAWACAIPTAPAERAAYYSHLFDMNIPGTAWFRHQVIQACSGFEPNACRLNFARYSQLYSPFSSSSIAEKLDPRAAYQMLTSEALSIDIKSLGDPAIPERDFKPLITNPDAARDHLASYIPADQHAFLFPSFNAMRLVTETLEKQSVPLLTLISPSQDSHAKARCDRQLCLEIDAFSKIFGPRIIKSMAFTGSDFYLKSGTDVAILFNTVTPGPLRNMIASRQEKAPNARQSSGIVNGIAYTAAVAPDRSICSYMATLDKILVVTNSLPQLAAIIDTAQKTKPSLAQSDDYAFVRNRYAMGSADESAIVIIPRAALLRFAGPKWRIAYARRCQLAAIMMDYQARFMDQLVSGSVKKRSVDANIPLAGKLRLTANGIISDRFGTLSFMTPIIELDTAAVTASEAGAYNSYAADFNKTIAPYLAAMAIKISIFDSSTQFDLSIACPFKPAQIPAQFFEKIRVTDPAATIEQTENSIRLRTTGQAVADYILKPTYAQALTRKCFDNLYILNEWKILFPSLSPVGVHENFWQSTLICPAGGRYVFNGNLKTMESTVLGSRARPREFDSFTGGIFDAGKIDLQIDCQPALTRVRLQMQTIR